MLNIELIQAAQGDCIWIEYGKDPDSLHRVLIDGGTRSTYKHLKKRIGSLTPDERHFDLLVITHIDADHIAGILKLIENTDLGITFSDIWFNGYKHLSSIHARGVVQGESLSDYLEKPHIHWNKAFHGKAVCVDKRKRFPQVELPGGMKLTLLSPTKKALAALKPHWKKEAQKAGLFPDEKILYTEDLDTRPDASESSARAILPDIDNLAQMPFEPDTSLTNGSSIAFVAEYEGKKMLFSGDAYATILWIRSRGTFRTVNHSIWICLKYPIMAVTAIFPKNCWNEYDAVPIWSQPMVPIMSIPTRLPLPGSSSTAVIRRISTLTIYQNIMKYGKILIYRRNTNIFHTILLMIKQASVSIFR